MQLPFTLRKKKVTTGRGSSLNFEDVHNVHTTLAHNWRQQKSEPKHLLPPEHRRQNLALLNNPQTSKEALVARFNDDQARRTKRAKTERRSAWWDAVVNLPEPPVNPAEHDEWVSKLMPKLRSLGRKIESTTGLELVDAVMHWDEGKLYEDGRVKYNGHAHLTFCRLQPDGKMLRFRKGDLQRLQTLVAYELDMRRGDHGTFATHLPPEAYRRVMEANDKASEKSQSLMTERALSSALKNDLTLAQESRDLMQLELTAATERLEEMDAARTVQDAQHSAHEIYLELRGAFKASGRAVQAHYIALKQIYHQGNNDLLESMHEKINDLDIVFWHLEDATGLDFSVFKNMANNSTDKENYGPSF